MRYLCKNLFFFNKKTEKIKIFLLINYLESELRNIHIENLKLKNIIKYIYIIYIEKMIANNVIFI